MADTAVASVQAAGTGTGIDAASEGATVEPRRARPVVWWATIGVAFVLLQLWAYVTWFTTGQAHRTPTGADRVPTSVHVWAWVFQVSGCVFTAVALALVVRQCRRERRFTWDAMMLVAWVSLYWQDPLVNYTRTALLYNSALVNLGSWVERIPGWRSPNGHLLPEPLLFSGNAYFWLGPGATLLACYLMRRARSRWPKLGVAGTVLCGLAGMAILDVIAEVIFIRTSLYAYSGAIHSLSVWGGRRYQYPVYEAVLWGSVWTMMGALRCFRNEGGRSAVERGVDRVHGARWHTPVRALALVGVLNVAMVAYNGTMMYTGLFADATPAHYPTWMLNGICGKGTHYECTGPQVPIPLPGSKAVAPFSGRN